MTPSAANSAIASQLFSISARKRASLTGSGAAFAPGSAGSEPPARAGSRPGKEGSPLGGEEFNALRLFPAGTRNPAGLSQAERGDGRCSRRVLTFPSPGIKANEAHPDYI